MLLKSSSRWRLQPPRHSSHPVVRAHLVPLVQGWRGPPFAPQFQVALRIHISARSRTDADPGRQQPRFSQGKRPAALPRGWAKGAGRLCSPGPLPDDFQNIGGFNTACVREGCIACELCSYRAAVCIGIPFAIEHRVPSLESHQRKTTHNRPLSERDPLGLAAIRGCVIRSDNPTELRLLPGPEGGPNGSSSRPPRLPVLGVLPFWSGLPSASWLWR